MNDSLNGLALNAKVNMGHQGYDLGGSRKVKAPETMSHDNEVTSFYYSESKKRRFL